MDVGAGRCWFPACVFLVGSKRSAGSRPAGGERFDPSALIGGSGSEAPENDRLGVDVRLGFQHKSLASSGLADAGDERGSRAKRGESRSESRGESRGMVGCSIECGHEDTPRATESGLVGGRHDRGDHGRNIVQQRGAGD